MINEINDKVRKFILDFGGSPDTLFMTKEMMPQLDLELCENLGTIKGGIVFMGMTVVETVSTPMAVGIMI